MTATAEIEKVREALEIQLYEPGIRWLNMLIYGDPGSGKTFYLGTAQDDSRTRPYLHIDIDGGVETIRSKMATAKKKDGIHRKEIRSLESLKSFYNDGLRKLAMDGEFPYKTIGVDNLSELAALDMRDIMKEAYSRNPDKVDIDVPSQREWGKSREHMRNIVRAFRDLPCNVIFTAHVNTKQDEGQPPKYQPGFAGKLIQDIPGFVDVVGYLRAVSTGEEVKRILQVQGTNRVIAKDRTQSLGNKLDDPTIPMMWDLIQNSSVGS